MRVSVVATDKGTFTAGHYVCDNFDKFTVYYNKSRLRKWKKIQVNNKNKRMSPRLMAEDAEIDPTYLGY